ncbi:hypothetical protein AB205_0075690, partial [Aquarana catesbeiana]
MEELSEGHKDKMEPPNNRNPPERCPHPLYSTQEDHTIPHCYKSGDPIDIEFEVKSEEETYVRDDQQSMEEDGITGTFIEEDTPTEISTDVDTMVSPAGLLFERSAVTYIGRDPAPLCRHSPWACWDCDGIRGWGLRLYKSQRSAQRAVQPERPSCQHLEKRRVKKTEARSPGLRWQKSVMKTAEEPAEELEHREKRPERAEKNQPDAGRRGTGGTPEAGRRPPKPEEDPPGAV